MRVENRILVWYGIFLEIIIMIGVRGNMEFFMMEPYLASDWLIFSASPVLDLAYDISQCSSDYLTLCLYSYNTVFRRR